MPQDEDKYGSKETDQKRDKEFKKWVEAQIALQRDVLKKLSKSDTRSYKEGQIALKELVLKKKPKN